MRLSSGCMAWARVPPAWEQGRRGHLAAVCLTRAGANILLTKRCGRNTTARRWYCRSTWECRGPPEQDGINSNRNRMASSSKHTCALPCFLQTFPWVHIRISHCWAARGGCRRAGRAPLRVAKGRHCMRAAGQTDDAGAAGQKTCFWCSRQCFMRERCRSPCRCHPVSVTDGAK